MIKLIKVPIFHYKFRILCYSNGKELRSSVKEDLSKTYRSYDFSEDNFDKYECFFQELEPIPILVIHAKVSAGTIAHECNHIKNSLIKSIYAKLDLDNDEFESYILEFIVDKVTEIIKKYKNVNS